MSEQLLNASLTGSSCGGQACAAVCSVSSKGFPSKPLTKASSITLRAAHASNVIRKFSGMQKPHLQFYVQHVSQIREEMRESASVG